MLLAIKDRVSLGPADRNLLKLTNYNCSIVATFRVWRDVMKTVSSREFNQDVSAAKRASKDGPVYITDRGKPSYVLLTIEDYQSMAGNHQSVTDVFSAPPAGSEIEFPRVLNGQPRCEGFD